MPDTVQSALRAAQEALAAVSESPRLDAELLLAQCLGWPRSRLFSHSEHALDATTARTLAGLLQRRLAGEPVAYLRQEQEFWSLPFRVGPGCLVPRPDSELLVEWAAAIAPPGARVLDAGTGSACIAVALAHARDDLAIVASDVSAAALALAADNVRRLAPRVRLLRANWLMPLAPASFDLIISNPPYVAADDPHLAALAAEPRGALAADEAGLADLRALIGQARACLRPGGWLLLEHGPTQAAAVRELLAGAGFAAVETRQDLAQRPRASGGRWS